MSKKRLICLVICFAMLLPCILTGCTTTKTDEEEGDAVDNSAKTITMWVMTSEDTTEQAKKLVNEAFTKITKSLYKTNVVIKFCTEDEYYAKLEGCINALQADEQLKEQADKELRMYLKAHKGEDGKTTAQLTADFYAAHPEYAKFYQVEEEEGEDLPETEEETILNEYGIAEIKYPDEKENQVDIFYISGYDKYMEYYNNEWLSSLSEELSSSSRKLTDYISPSLLNGVQIDGGVYAIPNNVPIGNYTYMMVDKALYDEYYNKIDGVSNVTDLSVFLNDMKNRNGDLSPDDPNYVVPLASSFEECLKMLVWYWDLDYNDLSVYDTYYDEERGRDYVLYKQYTTKVTEQVTDKEGNTSEVEKTVTRVVPSVVANMVYKTNEDGQFVDKDGNVLNYRYLFDEEGGWMKNTKGSYEYSADLAGAMYLVDEDGMPVTPETDKRVILSSAIEQEPVRDEDGGFLRDEDGNIVYGDKYDDDGNPVPAVHENHAYIWDETVATSVDADGNPRATYNYSYSQDSDFSVLGALKTDAATRTRGGINLNFTSLFTDSSYRELYGTLMNYAYQNYYGEPQEGQLAAVSFVKGDSRIKQEYEENGVYVDPDTGRSYYVIIAEYPEASETELYGNMFAVYSGSAYLARSMEIVTRLNTNSELRNLLQYGLLGQHYEVNEDGTAHLLTSPESEYGTYRMDIRKTGNCFIARPSEEDGPDAWTYAKIQNNDSLINPLLGFDFNTEMQDSEYDLDVALINHIKELNEEALALIQECNNLDELTELMGNDEDGFKRIYSNSAGDVKLTKAMNGSYDPSQPLGPEVPDQQADTSGASPFTVYNAWLNRYGYAAKTNTAKSQD